jgi:hypothetical protein
MRNRTGCVTANLGYRLVAFDQDGACVPFRLLSTANAGERSSCAWRLLPLSPSASSTPSAALTDSEQDIAGRIIVFTL